MRATALAVEKKSLLSDKPPWFAVPELKLGWPITIFGTFGSSSLANGLGNRRIRLFPVSATYRFPFESTASAPGDERPVGRARAGP